MPPQLIVRGSFFISYARLKLSTRGRHIKCAQLNKEPPAVGRGGCPFPATVASKMMQSLNCELKLCLSAHAQVRYIYGIVYLCVCAAAQGSMKCK